ncbi:carbohydrate sulfotransferase 3-like [Haliotis cracherodii]|uniref:carbohydrate sulfotransferase 3-like n=1 Tax=Haliotis cracherodii TaxID=6455 RepID=UPI0039E8747A
MECLCSPLRSFLLFTAIGFVLIALYSLNVGNPTMRMRMPSRMPDRGPEIQDTSSQQVSDARETTSMSPAVSTSPSSLADLNNDPGLRTSMKVLPFEAASSRTKLLIVTYMRSGSSLTGNLIEFDPNVFYVFEPLHELKWYKWGKNINIQYLKSKPIIMTGSKYARIAEKTIRNVFRCNFLELDIATLTQYHMQSSASTKSYHNCLLRYPGALNLFKCIPIINKQCMAAKVGVIKTIEFPITSAKYLATKDKSLKVLHLIRDPRATLLSQIVHGRFPWEKIDEESLKHCNKLSEDLRETRQWFMTSPKSIKILFYEDLCQNPSTEVKELYKFVGLNYTKHTERSVRKLTSASKDGRCLICTVRKSSRKASEKWRGHISMRHVKIIDRNCRDVYKKLGYLPVENVDILRNVSHPLRIITHA